MKNQTLRTVKDSPELHNKISAIFLFNMGLNSSTLPLTTTAGITANTTVNTVPSETGGGMDSHEEGVAHRENPSREDRPLQRKKPEATDTAAAGGTGGRGHRSHVREAEEGDGGRRDGGHAEELEALVDENELEQLVADIGVCVCACVCVCVCACVCACVCVLKIIYHVEEVIIRNREQVKIIEHKMMK